MHGMCDQDPCCCGGSADLDTLFMHDDAAVVAVRHEIADEYGINDLVEESQGGGDIQAIPVGVRGDSGYISVDAWPSPDDIGSFDDPKSTGRKRQARMFPIQVGQACEWAGKRISLPGTDFVMVGCLNSPATDRHHGPDKNTLNNEKASWGIGEHENTHLICSDCHNLVHGRTDPLYPEYDRIEQQTEPWIPQAVEYGVDYVLEDATNDELFAEELRRREALAAKGKKTRGRQAKVKVEGDLDVRADD